MVALASFLSCSHHGTASPGPATYAVAIGRAAAADPAWLDVAEALRDKHGVEAPVIEFDESSDAGRAALVDALRRRKAGMVGIVLHPNRAARDVTAPLQRALRTIDADPASDVAWGIITARTAEGARRLVGHAEPLTMSIAAGTADFPMQRFDHSAWWSEEAAHRFTLHHDGRAVDPGLDATSIGAAAHAVLDVPRIDLLMTGGHATERGLELGFRKPAGAVEPRDGALVVRCHDGRVLPLVHASPKAWIGAGNCLLGHVDGPDAVAAVAIESFGVRAHVGYVVVTWFGRGGWGTLDRFTKEPGVRTLNEAWRENSDAIVDELARRWPGSEALVLASWQRDDVGGFGREVAAWMKERSIPEADARELAGLLWDRDAVVYLGDPSWDVRVQRQPGTTVDPWSAMAAAGRVTGSSPAPATAPAPAP
jgi:zinc protease